MIEKENFTIQGAENRPFLADLQYNPETRDAPLVLFLHGFKGFKDWGHFNLLAEYLVKNGFAVMKINFSHNGTTPEKPVDFADLEAFGNNSLAKELLDIKAAVDFVWSEPATLGQSAAHFSRFNRDDLTLMGHSRGGGTAVVFAAADKRVKRLVTLASIASVEGRFTDDQIHEWQESGVIYIHNGRTNQDMPMYRQMLDEYRQHKSQLDPLENAAYLKCPYLIIHGSEDETVPMNEARQLLDAAPDARLHIVEGAGHTFGGKHPYPEKTLPAHTIEALERAVKFIKKHSA